MLSNQAHENSVGKHVLFQVTFANGYGNLTDIRVSRKGQYKFKVAVTYPENVSFVFTLKDMVFIINN